MRSAVGAARHRAADRARLRVRQRLPRHRQRGRDGDLHALAAADVRGRCGRASFNFLGVLVSSGAVAFGIISLLPVELILQVGSGAGFAMVFALLIAAIVWNLGTWWLGLPASSLAHADRLDHRRRPRQPLMHGGSGTSGVDWSQATKVGYSLLLSPLVGFCAARPMLLLVMKVLVKNRRCTRRRRATPPPPWWIRGLLIFTCTRRQLRARLERRAEGHGPDHADPDRHRADRLRAQPRDAGQRDRASTRRCSSRPPRPRSANGASRGPRRPMPATTVGDYLKDKQYDAGRRAGEWRALTRDLDGRLGPGTARIRRRAGAPEVSNVRNDMYLVSETLRAAREGARVHARRRRRRPALKTYRTKLDERRSSSRSG